MQLAKPDSFLKEHVTCAKWLLALIAVATCTPVIAEVLTTVKDLKPGTKIFAYMFSHEQMEELYKVGVFWDKKLGLQQNCKSQFHVKPIGFVILAPINLPENEAHPVEGAWKHRFEFERCGDTKIYNAIFVSKKGTKPELRPYFPGTSKASPQLIHDAMTLAVSSASFKLKEKGVKECKDMVVADMRVTQMPHEVVERGTVYPGVWQESWTFVGCGQPVDVLINFTPDGKGGTNYSTQIR